MCFSIHSRVLVHDLYPAKSLSDESIRRKLELFQGFGLLENECMAEYYSRSRGEVRFVYGGPSHELDGGFDEQEEARIKYGRKGKAKAEGIHPLEPTRSYAEVVASEYGEAFKDTRTSNFGGRREWGESSYKASKAAERAIRTFNDVWCGNKKLVVKYAWGNNENSRKVEWDAPPPKRYYQEQTNRKGFYQQPQGSVAKPEKPKDPNYTMLVVVAEEVDDTWLKACAVGIIKDNIEVDDIQEALSANGLGFFTAAGGGYGAEALVQMCRWCLCSKLSNQVLPPSWLTRPASLQMGLQASNHNGPVTQKSLVFYADGLLL
ncbi:hypothetical protein U1Q18_033737 [Sarracenia purpurea var. burkii]